MSYTSEVLADSPVGYFLLDEASGDPADSSGHGHNFTAVNGTPTYRQVGPITSDASNFAILLNSATPDWFAMNYDAAFDIGDVGSVEIWIKRGDTSTSELEIINRDQGFYLGLITNQLFIAKTSVAGIAKSTTTITDTTTWHHLVNTKNGATVHQYIDGVDVTGTVTNATWQNGTSPFVDLGANGGGDAFKGSIARPAIYATELSQARVSAHYAAATAGAATRGPNDKVRVLSWL